MSDYVGNRLAHLDNLYAQIERLEARAKELRELANQEACSFIQLATSEDERKELATAIYWEREFIKSDTVWSALGVYPQQAKKAIYPGFITQACADCGTEVEKQVFSRTDMANRKRGNGYARCPECECRHSELKEDRRQYWIQQEALARAAIEQLRSMPYTDYLKTDHWQNTRRKALKRAGFKCQLCNAEGVSLHVHHRTYERRGNENAADLIVLCANCHETFHENGVLS